MSDQLLATFYVQSPDEPYADLTVTARVQYPSWTYWYEDTGKLRCAVTQAHYDDENGSRRRYRVDVFRVETSTWHEDQYVDYYPLSRAGAYPWRLQVLCNNNVMLERMLYITVQPNVHVYVKRAGGVSPPVSEGVSPPVDLIRTEETVISANPLVKTLTVIKNESALAMAARNIALTQPNAYKETVFVKTNVPIDLVSDDLTEENADDYYSSSKWLQLKDQITVTRKMKSNEYQWGGYY